MNLPDHWYVIAETRELSRSRPNPLKRHAKQWVVWRTSSGEWILQQDRCPHRSARLSQGRLKNDCIECPFHGFQFNAQGACSHVPELGREAPGLRVESYRLHEAHGFLWWKKGNAPTENPPWFSDLPGGSWGTHDVHQWNQNITRCIENQLDFAHLPFVHASTIGAGFDFKRPVSFLPDETGVRILFRPKETQGEVREEAGIHFLYPALWRLKILPRMYGFIAFVAVDEETTRLYLRTYQSFVTVPWLRSLIGWILKLTNRKILNQDRAVVLGQSPKDVRLLNETTREVLFPSDHAVQAFRKWLAGPIRGD
jgi:phenylpropionate dioxygenase-like ring-hydroxylating dioxygenase large terminal subunit